MVVDRHELSASLMSFYDFRGKSVICVGAGGGLLLDPSSGAARVVAIDKDSEALEKFRVESGVSWAGVPIEFVPQRFEDVTSRADVVYFEFCMHQMQSQSEALAHARSMAPETVVMDHLPGSRWVYYWAGEADVLRSTNALESWGIKRQARFTASQRFKDREALAARLSGQGPESQRRILELKEGEPVEMPMDYGLYLL